MIISLLKLLYIDRACVCVLVSILCIGNMLDGMCEYIFIYMLFNVRMCTCVHVYNRKYDIIYVCEYDHVYTRYTEYQ